MSHGSPASGPNDPEIDADLVTAVRTVLRTARLLERVPTGLTVPQYRVLSLLDAGDERSTALAQRLAVSKPAISGAVDSLVGLGHLLRRGDVGDKRVSWLQITASGREAVRQADAALTGRLAEVVDRADDTEALVAALGLLGDVVEADLAERWARADA